MPFFDPDTVDALVSQLQSRLLNAGEGAEWALEELEASTHLIADRGPSRADLLLPPPEQLPDAVGLVYQAVSGAETRRAKGAFYTPAALATEVVRLACRDWRLDRPPVFSDPACGGGAFLLAAARYLEGLGLARRDIVIRHLQGSDIDPLAVRASRLALRAWADSPEGADSVFDEALVTNVRSEDPLLERREGGRPATVDAVVGNPPFLGQLRNRTVRSSRYRQRLKERFGSAMGAYTDTAALFVLAALDQLRPGGRVALILPESVLVARDAQGMRDAVVDAARVLDVWSGGDVPMFDASVRVCAPVLERSDRAVHEPVWAIGRWVGLPAERRIPATVRPEDLRSTWGELRVVEGPPVLTKNLSRSDRTLDTFCRATAGFRDQYYGLDPFVTDGDDLGAERTCDADRVLRLVTAGAVDPARCLWGTRPIRFRGTSWNRPLIDLAGMRRDAPDLAAWTSQLLRPKVLVATQTPVIEAVADVEGCWYPSVPVIAIWPEQGPGDPGNQNPDRVHDSGAIGGESALPREAHDDDPRGTMPAPTGSADSLWWILAVLLAPPVSAWAHANFGGGALSRSALKLSAKQLLQIPLPPVDVEAEAAALARQASVASPTERLEHLTALGSLMCDAYEAPGDVLGWWLERLR